ncbi:hypothetical protein J6590_076511 [Homalodisca vitripennis]|nr:hypothetical protein J6590_076511 [Homalodisca vitripennis]
MEVLPDVKPMLSEGEGTQAYPVAVVAQIAPELISVRQEDLEVDKDGQPKEKDKQDNGTEYATWQPNSAVADYFNRLGNQHPLNIHHFLKFSAETIKREQAIESSPLSTAAESEETTVDMQQTQEEQVDDPINPKVAIVMIIPVVRKTHGVTKVVSANSSARTWHECVSDGDDGSSPGTFRTVSRRRSIVAVALFARVFGDDVSSPWHAKG